MTLTTDSLEATRNRAAAQLLRARGHLLVAFATGESLAYWIRCVAGIAQDLHYIDRKLDAA